MPAIYFLFAGIMLNVCGICGHPMSSHDDHASCPQCRIAAGECHVDVDNPCSICGKWTSKQWSKLRRSLVDARARTSQRGRQHWTSAFSHLEAWIISKPAPSALVAEGAGLEIIHASGPASEISSVVSGDDLSDRLLVSTSSLLVQVRGTSSKWGQYGVQYGHYGTCEAVNGRAVNPEHNRTYCSYCCAIRGSGHTQCYWDVSYTYSNGQVGR